MPTTHLPLLQPGDLPLQVDQSTLRTPRAFRTAVNSCIRCPLSDDRVKVVPGSGSDTADVVIVGTAPGRQEDVQGQPFTGAAGNVIDNALAAVGARRADVFLTTLVKCHPTADRAPSSLEFEACFPWYVEQIAMLRPKVIVTLGELPTSAMLRRQVPIGRVAGLKLQVWDGITLLPTHDPADAIRGNARAAAAIRRDVAAALSLAARMPSPAGALAAPA